MANFPQQIADFCVTQTAAANTLTTASLPAPGAGLFHYITKLEIEMYSTAARAGNATPVIVTSTNLRGTPSWNFPTAGAIGTTSPYAQTFNMPIKSVTANTASTIVGPATASVIWKIRVWYYVAA